MQDLDALTSDILAAVTVAETLDALEAVRIDTLGKKNRKENLEREMDQVEADIKKLSKNYIFVDTTAPSTCY